MNLSLFIFDADPSGTPQGTIRFDSSILQLNWKGQPFAPNASLDPSDVSLATIAWGSPNAVSFTTERISNQTNRTRVNVSIMDPISDAPSLQYFSFPYRRICLTARTNGNDPGVTNSNWAKFCYRIYVRLSPVVANACPDPWAAAATAAAAGLPPPVSPSPRLVPCPYRALQELTVVGAGQVVEGWIYYLSPMRDGTPQCAYCDRVEIAVLSDPGIPNGAAVGPNTGGPSDPLSPPDRTNMVRLSRPGDPDPSNPETAYLYSRRSEPTRVYATRARVYDAHNSM